MNNAITDLFVSQNITLITLTNVPYDMQLLGQIFGALGKANINIDMVSQSSPLKNTMNISFTISDDDLFTAIQNLKTYKNGIPSLRIEVNSNNTKVCLYGEPMRTTPGVVSSTMTLLAEANVEVKMITTAESEISYLIYSEDEPKATTAFKEFFGIE